MGTITTEQAGKTYRVVQSNSGVRLLHQQPDGTFVEVFRHWPDAAPINNPPVAGDVTFSGVVKNG